MLTQEQITRLWNDLLAAETRALYFSDLATMYARQKQWITGFTFFLSSGAAATVIAKAPAWLPAALSAITAALAAYAIASGLDRKVSTMVKLASSWREIAAAYDRLWNHTYAPDASEEFYRIIELENAPSGLAATDAPTDEPRLAKWQTRVFKLHRLEQDAA